MRLSNTTENFCMSILLSIFQKIILHLRVEINAHYFNISQTEKRKISSKSVMAAKKLKTTNESAPMRSGLLAQLALSD